MERKIITEEQKEILKSWKEHFEAYMTDKGAFYNYDTPVFVDFCKLVEADYNTLCRLGEVYSGELTYSKEDELYIVTCLMKKEGCIAEGLSVELESSIDFLGLYSEKADNPLEDFFNDSVENVAEKLREEHADVYEFIEKDILGRIKDYDLDDSVKEDIADMWIEDNPNEAVEKAEDYLCSSDQKDIIIKWIENLM